MSSDTNERPSETGDAPLPEAAADAEGAETASAEPQERRPEDPAERALVLETELAAAKDQLLRALAEVENTRRRAERQTSEARAYAIERFAGDLLSVSDNLARALSALAPEDREALSEPGRNLLSGIEMTEKELHTVLSRHGVTAIDAAPGAAFDPNLHQAVSQIPSDQPAGSVAQTFQTGWRIGERTLRAAMVAVSAGPAN